MIDTETELEKIGHNNHKFVSNSMTSMEVRKIRPNEYMFIQVRSSQFPANLDPFTTVNNQTVQNQPGFNAGKTLEKTEVDLLERKS